jgi:hypothetical protein
MNKTIYRASELLPRAVKVPAVETTVTATVAPHEVKTGAPTTDHSDSDVAIDAKIKNVVGKIKESESNPVAELMTLRDRGADIETLLNAMNRTYAVVRYGSEILVANMIGNDISCMKEQNSDSPGAC